MGGWRETFKIQCELACSDLELGFLGFFFLSGGRGAREQEGEGARES